MIQDAGTTFYGATGVQDKIDNLNDQYESASSNAYVPLTTELVSENDRLHVIGDSSGPKDPYPFKFSGKVKRGEGKSYAETGIPSARIKGIPHDIKSRLSGLYFGWVSITHSDKKKSGTYEGWKQAVITAAPKNSPDVVPKTTIDAYIVHDFQGGQFFDASLLAILMGFLRPWTPCEPEELLQETCGDIAVTQLSLKRPERSAEAALFRLKNEMRSLAERYVDMRQYGQRQIDRIPIHKTGVRINSYSFKDKLVGNGGLFVLR